VAQVGCMAMSDGFTQAGGTGPQARAAGDLLRHRGGRGSGASPAALGDQQGQFVSWASRELLPAL
jgi:hypothetical protein